MIFSESDLIIPTLQLLIDNQPDGLTTSQIIDTLQRNLDISPEDLELNKGRSDSKFSQKVRNLISHKTLTSKDLATYESGQGSGILKITEAGKRYLSDNTEDYTYVMSQGFTEKQRKDIIERDFKDLVIEEGHILPVTQKEKRKRSRKLTELARKHYIVDGKIVCAGCQFSFDDFYGSTARNYIEIHHLKPIFTYEEEDMTKTLEQALGDVRPLCSNCHTMVHRNPEKVLTLEALQNLINSNGKFYKGN